jgi:peptidoglycan/LPS O-acetylase OafA/YrhL
MACLLLAAGILLFLPKSILVGGVIWLLGAGVFYLIQIGMIRRIVCHPFWLILTLMLTIGALLASRSGRIGEGADLLIGIGCAALVAGLATRASASYFYGMLSAGASEISYTLYLVHFPVLAFLFFGYFKGSQMTPGPTSGSWFAITLGGVLLYSTAIWGVFERNTDRVRKAMERSL